ncbi:serine hydrolase [Streptomyces sp. NBC_01190]|uniref:serine hydrolase n=1 Tax=Streptomyces sp. NBC_01190 TaxID=2903767 RepID=UPI0038652675|nr:serine hydrolase [Streptomyces sp. NBC_01190]
MSQERSPKHIGAVGADGADDGTGAGAGSTGTDSDIAYEADPHTHATWDDDRWWNRQMVLSVTALAVMAALTLAMIVHPFPARAGTRPVAKAVTPRPPVTARSAIPQPDVIPSGSPVAEVSPPAPSAAPVTPANSATQATQATQAPPTASPVPPAPPATTAPPVPPLDPVKSLARAIADVPGSGTGNLSVGVADLDGAASATYDSDPDDRAYDTASIVKVDILATLLLQHQKAGTYLTSGQRNLATSMIEVSDNDAAEQLWETIGGASGLAAANAALGPRHTVGGPGDLWGLTQTTAADQLALLRAVFGDAGTPLSADSRSYMKSLMTAVSGGQRWGVSAADSDGAGYALKNGWLQRTATGLWDINSIGLVTYEGHRLLISVLSSGQHSERQGIDLVAAAADAAAKTFAQGLA